MHIFFALPRPFLEQPSIQRCASCCKSCDHLEKMLVLKQTIRGGHSAPWFCLRLIGMPERLSLLVVWFEDQGKAMAILNA